MVSVFMTAQTTGLACVGRWVVGVSKQEGAGTVQDVLFLLIKALLSMWPPGYAAQQVSSVLSQPSQQAPPQGPQERPAAQVTS